MNWDTLADTIAESWMWVAAVYLLFAYEMYALWTQACHKLWPERYPDAPKPLFTITASRAFWRAKARYPYMTLVVLLVAAWLLPHLVLGETAQASIWTLILGVLFVVMVAPNLYLPNFLKRSN